MILRSHRDNVVDMSYNRQILSMQWTGRMRVGVNRLGRRNSRALRAIFQYSTCRFLR